MAKKKKTLEKKKLAEIHRSKQLSTQKLYSFSSKTNPKVSKNSELLTPQISTPVIKSDNRYLIHDLRKTIILTTIIILMQFLLRMIIN